MNKCLYSIGEQAYADQNIIKTTSMFFCAFQCCDNNLSINSVFDFKKFTSDTFLIRIKNCLKKLNLYSILKGICQTRSELN